MYPEREKNEKKTTGFFSFDSSVHTTGTIDIPTTVYHNAL